MCDSCRNKKTALLYVPLSLIRVVTCSWGLSLYTRDTQMWLILIYALLDISLLCLWILRVSIWAFVCNWLLSKEKFLQHRKCCIVYSVTFMIPIIDFVSLCLANGFQWYCLIKVSGLVWSPTLTPWRISCCVAQILLIIEIVLYNIAMFGVVNEVVDCEDMPFFRQT